MSQSKDRYRAVARVQVTVQVTLTQPWDGASTLDDVGRTASREAADKVRGLVERFPGARLIGEPRCECIITSKGDG